MKLQKAMAVKDGMSYIHLLSPCILGWGYGILCPWMCAGWLSRQTIFLSGNMSGGNIG